MPLYLHEILHFAVSVLIGYIVGMGSKRMTVIIAVAILGGFFIDLDHVIDYFLVFGLNFRFDYFFTGLQYLKGQKIYIFFHGYEYVVALLISSLYIKKIFYKKLILAFAFAILGHLVIDATVNELKPSSYSIINRIQHNFEMKALIDPSQIKHNENLRLQYRFD